MYTTLKRKLVAGSDPGIDMLDMLLELVTDFIIASNTKPDEGREAQPVKKHLVRFRSKATVVTYVEGELSKPDIIDISEEDTGSSESEGDWLDRLRRDRPSSRRIKGLDKAKSRSLENILHSTGESKRDLVTVKAFAGKPMVTPISRYMRGVEKHALQRGVQLLIKDSRSLLAARGELVASIQRSDPEEGITAMKKMNKACVDRFALKLFEENLKELAEIEVGTQISMRKDVGTQQIAEINNVLAGIKRTCGEAVVGEVVQRLAKTLYALGDFMGLQNLLFNTENASEEKAAVFPEPV